MAQAPGSPKKEKPKKSYTGELYSMYYNTFNSTGKSTSSLADNTDVWVMGQRFNGKDTTKWTNDAVGSVSYFTYRNRWPQTLGKSKLDHDAGWGCMHRTGQMMLSEALRRVFLLKVQMEIAAGAGATAVDESRTKRFVQNMFMDLAESPFGVHAIASEGENQGIVPGHWLTPTALCRTVRELVIRQQFISTELTVVLGLDGGVNYRDISDALFLGGSVLLLVPIMAGMRGVGKSYEQPILKCLEMPNTLGIVGGKPQKSLYFVGHQNSDVFYLDPHVVQPAFTEDGNFGTERGPRGTCHISGLDPNMILCFMFHSQEELDAWDEAFQPIHQISDFPMFSMIRPKPGGSSRKKRSSTRTKRSSTTTSSSGQAPQEQPSPTAPTKTETSSASGAPQATTPGSANLKSPATESMTSPMKTEDFYDDCAWTDDD